MAAKKMYVWSNIKYSTRNEAGESQGTKWAKCGSIVTQAQLGLNDAQWAELVDAKTVRPMPYPVPPGPNEESPTQYFKKLARMVEEDADDLSALQSVLPPLEDDPTSSVNKEVAA